ncbi:MAG: alkyl sulfatase C-terminal domain-containing protein, partial [Pseudomonadales bacterium]
TLTRSSLNDIILGVASLDDKIESGEVRIDGSRSSLDDFVGLLDSFELWFNIVTP